MEIVLDIILHELFAWLIALLLLIFNRLNFMM